MGEKKEKKKDKKEKKDTEKKEKKEEKATVRSAPDGSDNNLQEALVGIILIYFHLNLALW